MRNEDKTKQQLVKELGVLRQRAAELEASEVKRKQVEEHLRDTRDYLDSLLQHANALIIVWDANQQIDTFNRAFEQMTGYEAEEVVGQPLSMLFPEASRDESLATVRQTSSSEYRESVEIPILGKDGEIRIVLWNLANIYDKDSKTLLATIGQGQDITERKQAEERLKHLNLVLRTIRSVNQLIVWEKDRDKLLKGICDRLIETRGYYNAWVAIVDDSGRLVTGAEAGWGKDFLPLQEQLKRGELPRCGRQALGQSEVVVTEDPLSACTDCPLAEKHHGGGVMTLRLEYGGKVYGLLSVTVPVVFTVDEEEYSLFKEVVTDIAFALHNIEVEEERKRAEEALQEAREYAEGIVETVHEPLVVLDADLRIISANRCFYQTFKVTPEEVQGQSVYELGNRQWDIPKLRELLKEILPNNTAFDDFMIDHEFATIGRRVMLLNARRIYRDGNKTQMILLAIEDITERKRAEKQLRESEKKYRAIFETTGTATIIIEEDTTLSLVNTEFERLSGYSKKELEGKKSWTEFVVKDDLDRMKEYHRLRRVDEESALRNYEFRFVDRYGKVKDIFLTITMIPGTKQSVASLLDITERRRAEEELKQNFEKIQRTLEETVHALALTTDKRDPYTASHQRRVTQLACAIASEMGLSEEQIGGLHTAAVIHDIGKIHIPAEILSKPGQLTEPELAIMKSHPQNGHDIVQAVEFPRPVAEILLQHHERMDGSGYPRGLSGEDILLEARILGVADVVEAMSSHRPYRPALGIDKAIFEILENKGRLYDPDVVDACLRLFTKKEFKFEQEMT